jgi:hypothetical protein
MTNISRFGPPIAIPDKDEERERLVACDEAFCQRLAAALQSGRETPQGLLAAAPDVKHFQPWRFARGLP